MLTGNPFGLVERAYVFAMAAHEAVDQRRKYTGEPYITHPIAVAGIIATVHHTEAMLAAALLHDTVEDTHTTLADIESEFGPEVAELVGWLTDVSRKEDGNRATRKAIDRAHTAEAPAAAKTIKLADLIDNSKSIVAHDPAFARVYLREKAALLDVLKDGDATLWAQANKLLRDGLQQIEVLYAYRCEACGRRGEVLLPGDDHGGATADCFTCGAFVSLEWDGGVTLHVDPARPSN